MMAVLENTLARCDVDGGHVDGDQWQRACVAELRIEREEREEVDLRGGEAEVGVGTEDRGDREGGDPYPLVSEARGDERVRR